MNDSQKICRLLGDINSQLHGLVKSQASIRKSLRKLQIHLPGSGQAGEQSDGPVPPDKFRHEGKLYEDFTSLEWRVLESLWGHDSIEFETLLDNVYGHDGKDVALTSLIKRLNRKLRKKSFPATVKPRNGHFSLAFRKVQKRVGGDPAQTPCD